MYGSPSKLGMEYWRVPVSGLEFIDHYWTTKVRSEVPFRFHIARPRPVGNGSPCTHGDGQSASPYNGNIGGFLLVLDWSSSITTGPRR